MEAMTFGEKLRALMAERGISQRKLAALVPCDDGYISKLVNGHKARPSQEIAERLDGLLDAGGALAALRPRLPAKRAAHVELTAVGLAAAGGAASTHQGPVAPELADYFRDQLAGHYRADRYLGPLRLIPTGLAQYELLCDLANAARGTLRPRMWSLAAGYAGFLGWLYQDAGDIGRAVYWHDVMLERAHRSHDPHIVAFALHGKAMLHADLLDGHGVIDLVGSALVHADTLAPKVRVLALQQMAHGVSLVADEDARDECVKLLDQAAALVDRVDDDYPWGTACLTPHYLDIQRATCLVRLGRAGEALSIWDRIMPELSAAGARRDVGVFRARQAQAYAVNGEPEHAVTIAGDVVEAAAGTGSVRMFRELQGLQTRMRPWAGEQPGRLLSEMLAPLEDT